MNKEDPNKSKFNELKSYIISYEVHTKKGGQEGILSSRINLSSNITSMKIGSNIQHYEGYNKTLGLICPISGTNLFNPENQSIMVTIFDNTTGQPIRDVLYTAENFVTSPVKEESQKLNKAEDDNV